MVLRENNLVQKRNVLNEIRANNMTMQELRFFSIYLSKINKDKPEETRAVCFPMDDFRAIMELGRINIKSMKTTTNSLLCKVVNIPTETGGYTGFQLFKRCKVDKDENGDWFVEINAHDDALPLMFDFKDRYFSYKLYNALRLRSGNQLRMYELLKQYEKIGYRVIAIDELKELLGISKTEHQRYESFRRCVLDVCQKALAECTDIKFTYEPCRRDGRGGKIQSLKFTIQKNNDYAEQLTLDMFIDESKMRIADTEKELKTEVSSYSQRIEFLRGACNNEFSEKEINVLYDVLKQSLSWEEFEDECYLFDYLSAKYHEMDMHAEKGTVKNRLGYVKSLL